jgi:hypothetical protein
MRDIEEAPYTICRWLRATKFDARSILDRCAENQAMFDEAKEQNFHPGKKYCERTKPEVGICSRRRIIYVEDVQ